jgi:hypothetical protein
LSIGYIVFVAVVTTLILFVVIFIGRRSFLNKYGGDRWRIGEGCSDFCRALMIMGIVMSTPSSGTG